MICLCFTLSQVRLGYVGYRVAQQGYDTADLGLAGLSHPHLSGTKNKLPFIFYFKIKQGGGGFSLRTLMKNTNNCIMSIMIIVNERWDNGLFVILVPKVL